MADFTQAMHDRLKAIAEQSVKIRAAESAQIQHDSMMTLASVSGSHAPPEVLEYLRRLLRADM